MNRGLVVGCGGPAGKLALDDQQLRRVERSEDREQVRDVGIGRDLELAG